MGSSDIATSTKREMMMFDFDFDYFEHASRDVHTLHELFGRFLVSFGFVGFVVVSFVGLRSVVEVMKGIHVLLTVLVGMSVVAGVAEAKRDYYKILGVPRDATPRAIKKGYRQMAKIHHPDRSKLDKEKAEAKFQAISKAYEVLSDPDLKHIYDTQGEEGIDRHLSGSGGGGGGGGGFGGGGFNFNFGNMFGGGGGMGGMGGKRKMELELSLQEIYEGGSKKVYVDNRDGRSQSQMYVDIPAGIKEGEAIESPDGKIQFVVKEKRHPRFERAGSHLHTSIQITLHEALLGGAFEFQNIDGSVVAFDIPPGKIISPTSKKTFKGKGFPIPGSRSGRRGKLVVTFDIVFPKSESVTAEDRELLRGLTHWAY